MERGSSSRRPRADSSDEAESEDAALRSANPRLPPLAAAAHAAQVLRSSSLNPNADPFSASPGGRIQFSDSEESLEATDASPPSSRGKAPAGPSRRRRSRRRCVQPSGFMAAARREGPRHSGAVEGRLRSVIVHPPCLASVPDVDGFRLVESRRRWRRRDPAPKSRPVPDNLVGLCFNCLASYHVHVKCTFPSRCFSCLQEGHHARDGPRSRGAGKRGRSPARARGGTHATRRRRVSSCRDPAKAPAPSRVVRAANTPLSAPAPVAVERTGVVLVHGPGAAASDAAPSGGAAVSAGAATSLLAGNGVAAAPATSAGVAGERPVTVPPPAAAAGVAWLTGLRASD